MEQELELHRKIANAKDCLKLLESESESERETNFTETYWNRTSKDSKTLTLSELAFSRLFGRNRAGLLKTSSIIQINQFQTFAWNPSGYLYM